MQKLLVICLFILNACSVYVQAASPATQDVLGWGCLPNLPDQIRLSGSFVGVSNGSLLIAGGVDLIAEKSQEGLLENYCDSIFVLDDPDSQWSCSAYKLPHAIGQGLSLTWGDYVICLGGQDSQQCYADAFMIQLRGKTIDIITLPELPQKVSYLCGDILGDILYVAGGTAEPFSKDTLNIFWSLDLSKQDDQRKWQQLEPWPGPPRMSAVAAVQDGSFFLISGVNFVTDAEGETEKQYLKDAYRYAPDEGWQQIADLPHAVAGAPNPAVCLGQSHLLILGGQDGHPNAAYMTQADVLAYHTITDTWIPMGKVPHGSECKVGAESQAANWPAAMLSGTWWHDRFIVPMCGAGRTGILSATPSVAERGLSRLDYIVIAAYLLVIVGIGIYFSRKEKTTNDFFLGGQRVPWWAAGISILGTTASAISFMAIPALVYRSNWLYLIGNMAVFAVAPVIIFFYLPFFRRLNVTTAYEYLEKRFNNTVRLIGSGAFISFQFMRVGIILYLPAMALSTVTGFNIYWCIILMGVLAILYTALGGIEAVIWTDVFQVVILLGGAILTVIIILKNIPGGLTEAINLGVRYNKFKMVNMSWDISTAALWVVLVGNFLRYLIIYSSDQSIIQRYLTTANEKKAAHAIWANAFLQVPASILFFAVGTALWVFYKSHPAQLNPTIQTDEIFPWFIVQQLPTGLAGLVIASLFAAAMSSLDSSINSMATTITTDFIRRFRPHKTDQQYLYIARLLTVLSGMVGLAVALYMAMIKNASIWDQYLKFMGLFGGGLCGLFVAGIFIRRISAYGIIIGFLSSAVILWFIKSTGKVHFFLYGGIGIGGCVIVGWLVSWILPDKSKDLTGLTIWD